MDGSLFFHPPIRTLNGFMARFNLRDDDDDETLISIRTVIFPSVSVPSDLLLDYACVCYETRAAGRERVFPG